MMKNRLHHKDLNYYDYQKMPKILSNPNKTTLSKSNKENIVLFQDKEKDKYYMLVLKTTKDKKENYIKSFHLINKNEFNKY